MNTRVADRVMQTMAFDRKTFKDKTLGILGGAITHFYMVEFAKLNKQVKWVAHWKSEVDRLVNMDLVVAVLTEIKGKWDKRKAISETLDDVKAAQHRYRTAAINYVAKVYKLKKINKLLPPDIEQRFFLMVQESVDQALTQGLIEEDHGLET